jgi:FKBP-type peptidyl-prolyl cis-trans isomerase
MTKTCFEGLIGLALLLLTGCGGGGNGGTFSKLPAEEVTKTFGDAEAKVVTLPSGLKYLDVKEGTGAEAEPGKNIYVHYSGFLTDGTQFDSSVKKGMPFPFQLGGSPPVVIKGWEQGIPGMKVGGKRKLLIPSPLAYGSTGRAPVIPANANLIFEIELLKVE